MSIAYTHLNRASLRLQHAITYAKLDGTLKLLLKLICEHHNDELGYAWPGIERLALLAGSSERTVRRHLLVLQDQGLLVIEHKGRLKHYFIQEEALLDIAISDLQLGQERAQTWTPVTKTVTNEAPNLDKTGTKVGHRCPHNRGEERKKGTEKKNGGGTDAHAPQALATEPAPATPATPAVLPPALFASPENQNSPTAGLAENSAALVALVDQINAQRATNGKKPFVLADLAQLRAEAAKAGISPEEAAEWILERTGRNFFKADYFAPPAPPAAPTAPTAPAAPAVPPAPPAKPLSPEEQAAQEALAAQARARAMAIVQEMCSAKPAAGNLPATLVDVDNLRGPACWVEIIKKYMRGEHVNLRPLELACEALKINRQALRAQRAAQQAATA